MMYLATFALGRHIEDLPARSKTLYLKGQFAYALIYDISITLPKLLVLFFYARVFGTGHIYLKYTL